MPVTMLRASYCALKELDVILVTPSQSGPSLASTKGRNSPEARLGVLPQQLGSSVGLRLFFLPGASVSMSILLEGWPRRFLRVLDSQIS